MLLLNKRCGQPSCRCHHGGPLHQAHHITFREGGKTRTAYVPQDLLAEVQKWVQEHQRLKALIHEVSQLSLALIRGPRAAPSAPAGATLNIGPILAQTVRHFFPDLNAWIDQIHDPRFLPLVVYHKRFLVWWGLSLFLCKLSSRRQLDYQLNTDGPEVLDNLNRLAEHRPGQPAGEPDLGVLPGGDRQRPHRRLAAADGPAVDPHEGPGRGPAAGAVRRPDRRLGISRVPLTGIATIA